MGQNVITKTLFAAAAAHCDILSSNLDILVFHEVGSLDAELACLGIKVDGFHAHCQGCADTGTTHTACGGLRLHLPILVNARKALLGIQTTQLCQDPQLY